MLQELALFREDIRPGPSSQTTTRWPLIVQAEEERTISGYVSLNGGDITIQPAQDNTWDEVVEEILRDRAELWKRLADL
jgi:hypothetical protein